MGKDFVKRLINYYIGIAYKKGQTENHEQITELDRLFVCYERGYCNENDVVKCLSRIIDQI